jgi:hypothetical protein
MQRLRNRQKTKAVSGQRLGKHVPAATNTHETIEERCFLCGPWREVITITAEAVSQFRGRYPSNEIAKPTKQSSPHHRQFSKAHISSRFTHGFQNSVPI